jgi:hypothetical protein
VDNLASGLAYLESMLLRRSIDRFPAKSCLIVVLVFAAKKEVPATHARTVAAPVPSPPAKHALYRRGQEPPAHGALHRAVPTRFKSSGALDRARPPLQSILSRPEVTAKRPRPLSPGQCRVHETGVSMIADYVLQDGKRLGMRRVTSLDTAFVDDLFKKLLHKRKRMPMTTRFWSNAGQGTAEAYRETRFEDLNLDTRRG